MVDFFLKTRWLVLVALGGLIVLGVYTMFHLNIEAYPDLTNIQVLVTTEAPGMSPVEVEQLVTFPIESTLIGMPKTQTVRSVSKLGLSMITVVFDDSMDIYLARQVVSERPGTGPISNSVWLGTTTGSACDGFRRGVSVYFEWRAERQPDGSKNIARLGCEVCASDHSGHQRDQYLGRGYQTVHGGSRAVHSAPIRI